MTDWIENREFRSSPYQFKAPVVMGDMKLKWATLKKLVRDWYDANLRTTIETQLRKTGIAYVLDMDPTDYDNIVSLHQKRDR
jgi:hypothetical protein